MAKSTIKIRAQLKNDVVTVKALLRHPMETGGRKDKKTGEKIPAHFIEEVTCHSGGKLRMTQIMSGGVSKNPYVSFMFKGASKGDALTIKWVDNKGQSEEGSAKIK